MKLTLKGTPVNNYPHPVTMAKTPEELMKALRNVRSFMLAESDWTQVPDSPLDPDVKEQWRIWRQEMRDITKHIDETNVGDYFEVSDPPSQGMPPHWTVWLWGNFPTTPEDMGWDSWTSDYDNTSNSENEVES